LSDREDRGTRQSLNKLYGYDARAHVVAEGIEAKGRMMCFEDMVALGASVGVAGVVLKLITETDLDTEAIDDAAK